MNEADREEILGLIAEIRNKLDKLECKVSSLQFQARYEVPQTTTLRWKWIDSTLGGV